ncbi:YjcQ family protein [Brevibacillus reuszeri]|uniref:YjcQ family protein n=1 Tax=Brevibacillus reuszeri TaxID=54915 RepID=UPI000CCC33F7|nr:YjcQ family protein [Brevibacillus reuszeri]
MAKKTMDVIQEILEHLDKSLDDERVDIGPISPENLEISYPRWSRVIQMMLESELIEGFAPVKTLGSTYTSFKAIDPRITLRGIQFLADNSNFSKLYRAAKEIKDWIPGL